MVLLNTNVGPERVEVIQQPTGVIQVPGANISKAAFIISTTKTSAPKNIPTDILSLDEFVDQFGGVTEAGESFFAVRGFFSNAGTGAQALIIAVQPTDSGTSLFEFAENESPRIVTAGAGSIEDNGEIIDTISVGAADTWDDSTGRLSFVASSPDLSKVRVGDFYQDASGRMIAIKVVSNTNKTLDLGSRFSAVNLANADASDGTDSYFTGRVDFSTANANDGETVTLGSTVFEYDNNASVSGTNVAVTIGGSATATANNLIAAITANTLLFAFLAAADTQVQLIAESSTTVSDTAAAGEGDLLGGITALTAEDVFTNDGRPDMLTSGGDRPRIVRLFTSDQFNGRGLIQESTTNLGTFNVTNVSITGSVATLTTASGLLNAGILNGDILVDLSSNEFLILDVTDDNEVQVHIFNSDITPVTGNAVFFQKDLSTVLDTKLKENSAVTVFSPGTSFSTASAGEGTFAITLDPLSVGSLNGTFIFLDGVFNQVDHNTVVPSSTVVISAGATGANTLTYDADTGVLALSSAQSFSPALTGNGVALVVRDAANNDFIVSKTYTDGSGDVVGFQIAKGKIVSTSGGWSVREGQLKIVFTDSSFIPGTTNSPVFHPPLNRLETDSSGALAADDYFVVDLLPQSTDFIGTTANGTGLHALDAVDEIGLVMIPGVTSTAVQNALIDYVDIDRAGETFGLLSIPKAIDRPVTDGIVLSVTISSIVNGTTNSTVSFSGSPNLSAVLTSHLLRFNSTDFVIVDVDADDSKLTVASTSITGSGSASIINPSAVTYKDVIINNPSKFVAWYFNPLVVQDTTTINTVIVDPVGHVAGVMARIDTNTSIGGVSHAPAGISFAGLADTIRLLHTVSERRDGKDLRLAFINRIIEVEASGRLIFGGYTAGGNSVTADEQLIQIIRSSQFVKLSLESGLKPFIWENFSPDTQLRIENAILSFLRNNSFLFPAGLPESDQFRVISIEPTQDELDQGLLRVRLQVTFNRAVKFIEIALEFPIPNIG